MGSPRNGPFGYVVALTLSGIAGCGSNSGAPGPMSDEGGPSASTAAPGAGGGSSSSGGIVMTAMGGSGVSGSSGVANAGQQNSGGILAGSGGSASDAGAGGVAGATGGFAGSSGASGSTAAGGATTYPMIAASDFGRPTKIPTTTPFTLAEGPLWDPCEHRLLFVDVMASKIYSLANGQITVFASNTSNTNGIAFAPDGSLIMAQMKPGHVARRDKSGNVTTLDPPGSLLHTPDDVIVRSDGVIYFTDGDFPPVGMVDLAPLPVYAIMPGASKLFNGGTVPGPNGIELSPDEKTLYVDAYIQGSVVTFAVNPDGTITKGATLATGLTNPDSLCVDAAGNLYVGVSTGLQVIRPDGTRVGLIPVQSTQGVTNCAFGGDDGKTLYITAWTAIWQLSSMPIPGLEWMVNRQRLGCM